MGNLLPIPSPERVKDACGKFDQKYKIIEDALKELFGQYPSNANLSHVLLKVVALNRLYSAGVLAVEALADHIHGLRGDIDSALDAGSPEIVDKIAKVTLQRKQFNFFSFATKYCNWHNHEAYPIYDSRVERYLWSLQLHNHFSGFQHRSDIRKNYETFLKIMVDFRTYYKLELFNFKDIDKFLWASEEYSAAQTVADSAGAVQAEPCAEEDASVSGEPERFRTD
jgi:hypothetical protein